MSRMLDLVSEIDMKIRSFIITCTCAHPSYCYVVWVASKITNMFLHPLHSNALVTKAIVGLVPGISQVLGGQKAESPKTITRGLSAEIEPRLTQHILDRDCNNR